MKTLINYLPEAFLVEMTSDDDESMSPVNGSEANDKPDPTKTKFGTRELRTGDPVLVKNMKFEGHAGTVIEIIGDVAIVALTGGIGKKKFHLSDLEFDSSDEEHNEEKSAMNALNNLRRLAGYQ